MTVRVCGVWQADSHQQAKKTQQQRPQALPELYVNAGF